jgi:hypothetical protein
MGPGDVHAMLHARDSQIQATKEWFEGSSSPGFSHSFMAQETTYRLLEEPVTVSFDFAKGRLVSIFMFPSAVTREPSDKGFALARAFGQRLEESLVLELGMPEVSERELRWTRGGTRIRLMPLGGLGVEDATPYDAAVKEGELKPGQTRVEGKEPLPMGRLASEFWAHGGWRGLRWGMGPRDALDQLTGIRTVRWATKEVRGRPDPNVGELFVTLTDEDVQKGIHTTLSFGDAGLERITQGGFAGDANKGPEAEVPFQTTKRALVASHGRPTCTVFVDGRTCEWKANGSRIQVRLRAVYGDLLKNPEEWFYDVTLEYADPRARNRDEDRLREADLKMRTNPRTWSGVGVNGIRLGMGLGDALDRVRATPDPLGRGFSCKRQASDDYRCEKGWSSTVSADIVLHELSFSAAGRLSYASFEMHARSREDALARFVELRETLAPQFTSWSKLSYVKEDAFHFEDDFASASAHILTIRPSEWSLSLYYMEHKRVVPPPKADRMPPVKQRVKKKAPKPASI